MKEPVKEITTYYTDGTSRKEIYKGYEVLSEMVRKSLDMYDVAYLMYRTDKGYSFSILGEGNVRLITTSQNVPLF